MTAALTFQNLTLGYDRHPAVHHLDAAIKRGSMTAIVGPNGAGKSTLLKSIVGVLPPMEGQIQQAPNTTFAYLPQQSDVDRSFPMRVADFVALGLWREIGAFGGLDAHAKARVTQALQMVGLPSFAKRSISALSGGEMQRVLFARLILQDADIIILDEPFAAVDSKTSDDLIKLVADWHAEGRTVLAVLHDYDMVTEHFEHTLMLARELVAHGPTAQVMTLENRARARGLTEIGRRELEHPEVCDRSVA
ncbi:MAG: zinc ABC transporter ATP-binding protein AztA [Pseudomonadota bacterium]